MEQMEKLDLLEQEPFGMLTLIKEVNRCVKLLYKSQECKDSDVSYTLIKYARYQILTIINKIKKNYCIDTVISKQDVQRYIFLTEMDSGFEQSKIRYLRKEWSKQQHTLAKLQTRLIEKCNQLSLHNIYCSSQGTAICSIIASILGKSNIVDHMIKNEEKYIIGLVNIAEISLLSFTKWYENCAPLKDAPDFKFMMVIYKSIHRISNTSKGCEFLITKEGCQNMLRTVIHCIPIIKHSISTNLLKGVLWAILFNIEISKNGENFLQGCSSLLIAINSCIHCAFNIDLYHHGLKILNRITKNIPNMEYLKRIKELVSMERLSTLANNSYFHVDNLPREIIKNLEKAAEDLSVQEDAIKDTPQLLSCKYSRMSVSAIKKLKSNIYPQRKKVIMKDKFRPSNIGSVANYLVSSNLALNENLEQLFSSHSYVLKEKNAKIDMLFSGSSSENSVISTISNNSVKSFQVDSPEYSISGSCTLFYNSSKLTTFLKPKRDFNSYKTKKKTNYSKNRVRKLKKKKSRISPTMKCLNDFENDLNSSSSSFITVEEEYIYPNEPNYEISSLLCNTECTKNQEEGDASAVQITKETSN